MRMWCLCVVGALLLSVVSAVAGPPPKDPPPEVKKFIQKHQPKLFKGDVPKPILLAIKNLEKQERDKRWPKRGSGTSGGKTVGTPPPDPLIDRIRNNFYDFLSKQLLLSVQPMRQLSQSGPAIQQSYATFQAPYTLGGYGPLALMQHGTAFPASGQNLQTGYVMTSCNIPSGGAGNSLSEITAVVGGHFTIPQEDTVRVTVTFRDISGYTDMASADQYDQCTLASAWVVVHFHDPNGATYQDRCYAYKRTQLFVGPPPASSNYTKQALTLSFTAEGFSPTSAQSIPAGEDVSVLAGVYQYTDAVSGSGCISAGVSAYVEKIIVQKG